MLCDICLENNENFIDFISDEGISLKIAEKVYKLLPFCFDVNCLQIA